jgi:GxxExxY protein
MIQDAVVLELKCVEHVQPVPEARLLTYLRLSGKRVGLIVNFHLTTLVRGGVVRKVV